MNKFTDLSVSHMLNLFDKLILPILKYGSEVWGFSKAETIGWLVVFGLTAFETVFQSISGRLPERGRKKREVIDERNRNY